MGARRLAFGGGQGTARPTMASSLMRPCTMSPQECFDIAYEHLRFQYGRTNARLTKNPMVTEHDLTEALKTVKYPGYSRDIVSFGLVKEVAARSGAASVVIHLTGAKPEIGQQIKTESERALRAV